MYARVNLLTEESFFVDHSPSASDEPLLTFTHNIIDTVGEHAQDAEKSFPAQIGGNLQGFYSDICHRKLSEAKVNQGKLINLFLLFNASPPRVERVNATVDDKKDLKPTYFLITRFFIAKLQVLISQLKYEFSYGRLE